MTRVGYKLRAFKEISIEGMGNIVFLFVGKTQNTN